MVTVNRAQQQNGEQILKITEKTKVFNKTEESCVKELWEDYLYDGANSEYQFLVGQIGDEVAGFICYGQHALTEGAYDIYWIAVDPKFQKHGVGAVMIQRVWDEVKQLGGSLLIVETSSTPPYEPARNFYLRTGFILEATIHDFYSAGDHLQIYTKPVDKQDIPHEDHLLQQA
ncbi:MAG: GNAT family N-acetyltransferase [Anaerolineales bacterium]